MSSRYRYEELASFITGLVSDGVAHAELDEGIRRNMSLGAGVASSRALPRSLEEALDLLSSDAAIAARVGAELSDVYLRLKRTEIAAVKGENEQAICARYAAAY